MLCDPEDLRTTVLGCNAASQFDGVQIMNGLSSGVIIAIASYVRAPCDGFTWLIRLV